MPGSRDGRSDPEGVGTALPSTAAKIPVYRGKFGPEQAERLLWRAGFGPRRGQPEALAKKGLNEAVRALTAPGRQRFVGPRPSDEKGRPLGIVATCL